MLDDAIDIIVFGSYVKGRKFAKDIDIAIIVPESKKIEVLEKLPAVRNLDIEVLSPDDLERNPLLAFSIFHEGVSLKFGSISKSLGLKPYALYVYSLRGKSKSEKNRFASALSKKRVERLAPGVMLVEVSKSSDVEEFLNYWKVPFKKRPLLTV